MNNLQQEHDEHRARYMAHEITFAEHYEWLASKIGLDILDLPVPIQRVAASIDPHLNDIALMLWDRRDPIVRGKAVRAGMRSWSLSDTVCCLKALARKLAVTLEK